MARIAQIQQLIVPPAAPMSTGTPDVIERRVAGSSFSSTLAQAQAAPTASTIPGQAGTGSRALGWAESQIGQAEQPPGSNDGPAIATYRSAVAGAQPGEPWCAYFVSWAAAKSGAPLGDTGQGLGSVSQITDWAQRTGRLEPAGSTPQPGDLILYGTHHVGMVESVAADGSLTTVEGNEGDAVRRVQRSASEATGFVRL